MTGLYHVCPPLGHLPGITMECFQLASALCGVTQRVVRTLCGHSSVKAQRAHLTHRSVDGRHFGGCVAIMAAERSPIHSLKC